MVIKRLKYFGIVEERMHPETIKKVIEQVKKVAKESQDAGDPQEVTEKKIISTINNMRSEHLDEDELVNLTIEILKEKGIEAKPENDITDRDVVYQIYKYFSKLGQMSNKSYLDGENFNISAKEILKLDPVTLGSSRLVLQPQLIKGPFSNPSNSNI